MAARYPPAPPVRDPWKERFEFEAKAHTRFPFPTVRKGEPIKDIRRKPPGIVDIEKKRAKVRGLIWK